MDALRRFLPRFLETGPGLSAAQWRAVHAIRQCRTPALGGHLHSCPDCAGMQFVWHSCNHKACPQCGRAVTQEWVERQLEKLADCPYFLVTFTLPQELRGLFFGTQARESYDLFFHAASEALAQTLASPKWLGACVTGATAVLHTWNQQLLFHPHIHCIVPGAGLDAEGRVCRVKDPGYLLPVSVLRAAFKQAFGRLLDPRLGNVDPAVWSKDWGVHIQPCGSGASAVKYLGAYVARTAIGDSRIVKIEEDHVTLRWKDRADGGREKLLRLDGIEFVRRYLRHVLPPKMHAARHYGYCHPAAKKNRERVRFLTGMTLVIQNDPPAPPSATPAKPVLLCPCCGAAMRSVAIPPCRRMGWKPPTRPPPDTS